MIDLFLTVDKIMFRYVRAVPSLSMNSTHRIMIATLKWNKESHKREKCKTRFHVEKLKDPNCVSKMKDKISNKLEEVQASNLEGEGNEYKNLLTAVTVETLGIKISNNEKLMVYKSN